MSSEHHYNHVAQCAPVQCKALRRAHNMCKHAVLQHALRIANVPLQECACIDLACGRGGDLNKLAGCRLYTGVDTALQALAELKRRATEIGMTVHLHHTDASQLQVEPGSADLLLCNFALHYFCDSQQHCGALLDVVAAALRPGGVFCGTYEKVPGKVHWGTPYHAKIGDCVDALEWRVPWPQIVTMLYKRGLALVCHRPLCMINEEADSSIIAFILQKAQAQ